MRGAGPRIEKRLQPLTCDSVTRSASFYWVNTQEITEQSAFLSVLGLQLNTQRVEGLRPLPLVRMLQTEFHL